MFRFCIKCIMCIIITKMIVFDIFKHSFSLSSVRQSKKENKKRRTNYRWFCYCCCIFFLRRSLMRRYFCLCVDLWLVVIMFLVHSDVQSQKCMYNLFLPRSGTLVCIAAISFPLHFETFGRRSGFFICFCTQSHKKNNNDS